MADETRKLQKDPPEGSRKVVEHELGRQSGKAVSPDTGDNKPKAGGPGRADPKRGREGRD
jgi:hypothetical protein